MCKQVLEDLCSYLHFLSHPFSSLSPWHVRKAFSRASFLTPFSTQRIIHLINYAKSRLRNSSMPYLNLSPRPRDFLVTQVSHRHLSMSLYVLITIDFKLADDSHAIILSFCGRICMNYSAQKLMTGGIAWKMKRNLNLKIFEP